MSKIEQIIDEIEHYLDKCKSYAFSNSKIIVDKERLEDMLSELRMRTPDEIKKYQKIINNKDAIIADANEQAEKILSDAKIQRQELLDQHEVMQRAYIQAEQYTDQAKADAQAILDQASEDANNIRLGAIEYTDQMLSKLQYIIEHSIQDNKTKYNSLITDLEDVLSIVNNNRNELHAADSSDEDNENSESDTETDN